MRKKRITEVENKGRGYARRGYAKLAVLHPKIDYLYLDTACYSDETEVDVYFTDKPHPRILLPPIPHNHTTCIRRA